MNLRPLHFPSTGRELRVSERVCADLDQVIGRERPHLGMGEGTGIRGSRPWHSGPRGEVPEYSLSLEVAEWPQETVQQEKQPMTLRRRGIGHCPPACMGLLSRGRVAAVCGQVVLVHAATDLEA